MAVYSHAKPGQVSIKEAAETILNLDFDGRGDTATVDDNSEWETLNPEKKQMIKYLAELTRVQKTTKDDRDQQMMKALTDGIGKVSVSAAAMVAASQVHGQVSQSPAPPRVQMSQPYGRNTLCYQCGQYGHIKPTCTSAPPTEPRDRDELQRCIDQDKSQRQARADARAQQGATQATAGQQPAHVAMATDNSPHVASETWVTEITAEHLRNSGAASDSNPICAINVLLVRTRDEAGINEGKLAMAPAPKRGRKDAGPKSRKPKKLAVPPV